MKKAVADMWVKALLSGKYKQVQGYLSSEGKHCCLGVLCEVAKSRGVQVEYRGDELRGTELSSQPRVLEFSGVKFGNGILPKSFIEENDLLGFQPSLSVLNDNGSTFKQIAKIIKKYWRYL